MNAEPIPASASPLSARRAIPGLPALPWLGSPWSMLSHPGAYLLDGYRRLGPVFRFDLMGMRMVALIGPEANRLIMVTQRERFSHALGYAFVRTVLGDGLLFQDGEVHRRNRTLMTPAFHQRGVQQYFAVIAECAASHIAGWAGAGRGAMYERFRDLTFDIMARLVLGVSAAGDISRLGHLNDQLAKGTVAFLRVGWSWTTFGKGLRARDALRAYLRGVIRARRDAPGSDALGLLMAARDESGAALSEDELLEQAVILMFAGHETTTSMLTSFMRALRDYPDVHRRLVDEQRRVVGDGALTLDHVKQMDDLDLVLKEVERVWPPISLCQRGVVETVEHAGYVLPPGTLVIYSPWVTHRIPEVFRDPQRFDPDRFAPPREEHRATPYSLVGFGGGPRLCIGQAFAQLEMKVVASLLLRHYCWEIDGADPQLRYVPTLYPRSGLPGTIRPRT
jgi:retinoid hydroxylase